VTAARPTLRALGLATAVIAADQGTKALARAGLERGETDPILPGLKLVNVRNSGVAFGFLSDGGAIVAAVTGVALVALIAFFVVQRNRPLVWLPVGLLLGGALGNLIDRIAEGAVTDFLKIPKWPAFNVADIAITFGVLALLYVLEGPPRHAAQEPD
jgi:signal peptidase II